MKKKPPPFEPWCSYPEGHDIYEQNTQPLAVIPPALPTPAMLWQNRERFRQLKALSDASGVRFLFVYLYIERGRHLVRQGDVVPRITRALYQLEEQGLL
ncbi:MAG: hypothetical protein JO202_03650 [Ktedonobacteraceae bacterium]|nr:hypothetical protein [Ktedonobacteraceae bacterium]